MGSEDLEKRDIGEEGQETPVCLKCMEPVDRLEYYCPHCGEACNQLTPYLPFVNLQWAATGWGRVWRQMWSGDTSIKGRIFRLFMIVWNVPFLLVGLLFKKSREEE